MIKIAMIGAGSAVFLKNLLTDILDFPELREVKIALHDIDQERLETAGMMARWTARQFNANAVVEEHADRRAAVDGADFVINMVQIGMHEATMIDFDIPRRYGIKQTIADTVTENRVVLFMKGTKSFPQCGFSQRAVEILKKSGAEFKDVNVLADPAIREGIKQFSNWPTIPQVYIDGKFVGGCDIIREMHASGELEPLVRGAAESRA